MKSLTKGNPLKLILIFAIPILIGQFLQILYSIVDTRIVGMYLGEEAIAAVGGTTILSDLSLSLLNGLMNGFGIIVATCFGANDEKKLKKSVASTFLLGVIIAVILTFFTVVFLTPILHLLNVPDAVFLNSYTYIRIILMGMIATVLYNGCASVLRAIGDTLTPLLFLVVSCVLNIFLDLLFVAGFNMGVAGAAYATVISQVVSFILCLIYMWKKYPLLHVEIKDFGLERDHTIKMLKAGFSMGLMHSLVNFGTLALQTSINTFGTQIIVAHTAARKITSIYMLMFPVFGQALATFCGQNMGAGKYSRIRQGIKQSLLFVLGWDVLVLLSAYTIAPVLIRAVTASDNQVIISTATNYLKFNTVFYFVTTFICLVRNSFQGIGDTVTPIISSFCELLSKVAAAYILAPALGYNGIIISEPIAWWIMVIPLFVQYLRNPILNGKIEDKNEIPDIE